MAKKQTEKKVKEETQKTNTNKTIPKSKNTILCSVCGEELTENNSREFLFVCLDCQLRHFKRLEEKNGSSIALFICCAAYNVPIEPLIIPENFFEQNDDPWRSYLDLLNSNGLLEKNGEYREFFDGTSDLRKIFGKELSQRDFSKYIEIEKRRLASLPGTAEQREKWGEGELYRGYPLDTATYDELDRQYASRAADFKGQSLSLQQRDALIKVCKWNMTIDYLLRNGNVDVAQKLQKMVQVELESEQMRKKDDKPVEEYRTDGHIVALENAGFMEDGKFKNLEETQKGIFRHFIKRRKYGYSLDVADQILFDMTNNVRQNADLAILTELPDDLKIEDEFGEFEPEETEEEKARKRYAGVVKLR